MAISSPGLGSGLDVNSIVTQLMEVERQPLLRLDQQEARVQADISSYGALRGSLSQLQSSLSKLQDAETFQATGAVSSDTAILSVTSDTEAVNSSYSITVDRLAQKHKLGSAEFASSATFGGNVDDELMVIVGSESFSVDLSTAKTLTEIQQAINTDSNKTGVTAGLINGDSGMQTLVLTSAATGLDKRVQLSFGGTLDSNTFNFSMLNRDADNVLLATENELDASLTIDGVTVTRGDNTISDVVDGVTLKLRKAGQANVSISPDSSVAQKALAEFVQAYNLLKNQTATLSNTSSSASVLRNVDALMRGILNNGVTGVGDYSYLSQLGVTTNSETGILQFDSAVLSTALEQSRDSVIGFFSDADNGFANKVDSLLEGFLQTGGTIDGIINSANNRVSSIERSRESMERRMETIELRYLKQFGALDTLMASMSTTSEFLSTQLEALSNLVSGNNN